LNESLKLSRAGPPYFGFARAVIFDTYYGFTRIIVLVAELESN
jgi:hypothetical protein